MVEIFPFIGFDLVGFCFKDIHWFPHYQQRQSLQSRPWPCKVNQPLEVQFFVTGRSFIIHLDSIEKKKEIIYDEVWPFRLFIFLSFFVFLSFHRSAMSSSFRAIRRDGKGSDGWIIGVVILGQWPLKSTFGANNPKIYHGQMLNRATGKKKLFKNSKFKFKKSGILFLFPIERNIVSSPCGFIPSEYFIL